MEDSDTFVQGPGPILLTTTPIRNVADASPRLIRALGGAEIIAAEGTCRLLGLTNRLQMRITGTLISLYDHNEVDKARHLVDLVEDGARVLLVSDAGISTVSGPGFQVIRAAVNKGVQVGVLPGPSTPIMALAVSGLPSDRFGFEELLPHKPGEAQVYLLALAHGPYALIFFESSKCLDEVLCMMTTAFDPQHQGVVCRELTKTHEEILRGELESLVEQTMGEVLGEITTVITSYQRRGNAGEHVPAILALASEGMRLKDAAAEVAEATGLRKNKLYKTVLRRKGRG